MYKESVELLKCQGVKFEEGLTQDELVEIEKVYEIQFPESLKIFLMSALPISKGFYNWRNFTEDNIRYIKEMLDKPIKDIESMAEEVYWCDEWGREPSEISSVANEVRKRLKKAPKLVPVFAHRYIPMLLEDNPPIISVHGVDIIYYGENLVDYFRVEFGGKKQEEMHFENIKPITFWSEIM